MGQALGHGALRLCFSWELGKGQPRREEAFRTGLPRPLRCPVPRRSLADSALQGWLVGGGMGQLPDHHPWVRGAHKCTRSWCFNFSSA